MNVNAVTTRTAATTGSITKTADRSRSFSSYLGESEELDAIFKEAANKYGVDVNVLKAIAKAESDFNPNSTSHCGAMGIMQLMPATAKELGVTNAYDVRQNIMGGAKLISNLLKKYDGNLPLALAGYNAGTGNVRKYGGIPPFKETQNYIKKITGYLETKGTTGATVLTYPTKQPESVTDSSEQTIAGQTVIPSGLQLKRQAAESAYKAAAVSNSGSSSILEHVQQSSTDAITTILRKLEESGTAEQTNEVFAYEEYLKFVDLFYVDDEQNGTTASEKSLSDAEVARLQMTASIRGLVKNI